MKDAKEIQPVDGYVKTLLQYAKKEYHLNIDPELPTRGQRLEAALAMKDKGNGYSSMEMMVGRRVDSSEFSLIMLLTMQGMFPQDPKTFYDGFAHDYWPSKE